MYFRRSFSEDGSLQGDVKKKKGKKMKNFSAMRRIEIFQNVSFGVRR